MDELLSKVKANLIGTRKPVRAVTAATPASIPARQKAEPLSATPIWNCAVWMPTVPTTFIYRSKTSSIL